MDRVLGELCAAKKSAILTGRRLSPVFYNARADEIEENRKAASHAGGRTGLSPLLRYAHVHAAAAHSAGGGARSGVDRHSVRWRHNVPSRRAFRSPQHSGAIGHDSPLESRAEGQSIREMAHR